MMCFKYLVAFLFLIDSKDSIEVLGKICTLESTKNHDIICKPLCDCPWAEKFIEINGSYPWTCGNESLHGYVCCPVRKKGFISKKMCEKYSSLVYEEMESPTMLANSTPIKVYKCGQEKAGLIIGGKVSESQEFPHMVLIGSMKANSSEINWACGGTILSEYYILTAGHCLNSSDYGVATFVKMGITNRNDNNFTQYKIAETIKHPYYSTLSHYHDIALLKLDEPARFSPFARPACLYTGSKIEPQKAIVTGWGLTKTDSKNPSDDLMKLQLFILNHSDCNKTYKPFINRKFEKGILEDIQFCAGPRNSQEEKDTCPGDSGGPIQIFHRGDDLECMYDILGVVSFGKPCPSSAGVYVKVPFYIDWIENIVWPYLP